MIRARQALASEDRLGLLSFAVHLRAFLKDPKGVAALVPTSSAVTGRIASKVGPRKAGLIVEYGPGSGVLTRALLERLRPDGRLVAIERNAELAGRLTNGIEDRRLTVVRDSAEQVRQILDDLDQGPVDYVFSGIPFFWLTPEAAARIVANTREVLATGGSFVAYQMFYLTRRRLRVHLDRSFSTVHAELDLRNLPPSRIYQAVR